MKSKLSKDWFDICILFISVLGIYAGLSDLDYVWQADLGRQVLQDGNFSGYYSQIWGSLGVTEYYDHEWLCNVLFYLFSFIPYKPLVWLKFFICLCTGVSFVIFIREFELNKLSNFKKYQILIIYALYALVFLKVKAYSFSVICFILELVILNKYRKRESNKLLIYFGILCVFWTNIHSGSVLLFFVVAGLYWLVYYRNIKLLVFGVVMLGLTCVNPYGYKLVLFNISHNFNSVMKTLLLDWQSIDAKTEIGFVVSLLVLHFIWNIFNSKTFDRVIFYLSLCTLLLSLGSIRHIIYFIPLAIIGVAYSRVDFKLNFNNSWLVAFFVGLWCLTSFSTFSGDYNSYSYNYVSEELEEIIYNIEDDNGLFNEHDFVNMTRYGRKNFITGAFPLHSQRVIDGYMMLHYLSPNQLQDVIDYYDLNKFIFNKYNLENFTKTGYLVTNNLYNYLMESDSYEIVYNSEELVYIRKKGTK